MKLSVLRMINLAFIVSIFIYAALIYFTLGERAMRVEPLSLPLVVIISMSLLDIILGVAISTTLMNRCRERAGNDKDERLKCLVSPYLIRWALFESGAVIGVAGVLTLREGLLIWLIPSLISLIALAVDHIGTYTEVHSTS